MPLSMISQVAQPYFQPLTEGTDYDGQFMYDLLVDHQGYLWSGGSAGLFRYDGYEFASFPAVVTDSTALSHSRVTALAETDDGTLWVATTVGLNRYDRRRRRFRRWFEADGLPSDDVTTLAADGNELLVATTAGLRRYSTERDTFLRPAVLADSSLLCIYVDLPGYALAGGTAAGLHLVTEAGEHHFIPTQVGERAAAVTALTIYRGELYVGTQAGLFRYAEQSRELTSVFGTNDALHEVACNDLLAVDESLWITTRGQGLLCLKPGGAVEQFLPQQNLKSGLLDYHTRSLVTNGKGTLWISSAAGVNQHQLNPPVQWHLFPTPQLGGNQVLRMELTATGGLMAYLRLRGLYLSRGLGEAGRVTPFPINDYLNDRDVNDLYTDRSGVTWITRGFDGLYGYAAATDRWLPRQGSARMAATRLNFMGEDARVDGLLWIGTGDGLLRYDTRSGAEHWYSPDSKDDNKIVAIYVDPGGTVWMAIGTYYQSRICRFDPQSERFEFVDFHASVPAPARNARITKIRQAPDGTIWALSNQGLLRVDTARMEVQLLEPATELGIGVPRNFHLSKEGHLWIGTDAYIHRYDPEDESLLTFPVTPGGSVSGRYAPEDSLGRVYFPTDDGILVIHPDSIPREPPLPQLVLNDVFVNGNRHDLPTGRNNSYQLALATGERDLRITFAALAYERASAIRYAYRRLGENVGWQELGESRSLAFTDMPAGVMTVQIRSDDGQGRWNPEALELDVLVAPYWYEKTISQIIMLQLLVLTLFFIGQFLLERRLEREAHAQLIELDNFKSRFFTNITHEFRTPLTLILGPARRLAEAARRENNATLGREARRIDRQGHRLMRMINQLLDLRKLEAGRLEIDTAPTALRSFCAELVTEFQPEAEQQGVELTFSTTVGEETTEHLDRDKLHSMITNLVANALRFTPTGGRVEVRLAADANDWWISVADTGPGIDAAQQQRIFEPFIQAVGHRAGGTGIGLALTREFCELLGGSLELMSQEGQGSTFTIRMPRRPAAETVAPVRSARPTYQAQTKQLQSEDREQLPLVLIVEDDPDVLSYLGESLSTHFRVTLATNGKEGIERARHELPDLVISDVMMPGMTGLQLCAQLKSDPLTAHLPVLLLTARTAEEHRLEGLERGADAYLTKPFSERELHLRLRNLLQLRDATARQLRESLLGDNPKSKVPTPPEQAAWLTDLRTFILDHLDDPDLSGEALERAVGMSRSQLHRKLQGSIGLSASRLVNQLRLEAARERLSLQEDSIAEVAYACGFRDPAYFSRKFRERYGVAPSSYREQ